MVDPAEGRLQLQQAHERYVILGREDWGAELAEELVRVEVPTTGVMQASRVNEVQSLAGLPSPSLSVAEIGVRAAEQNGPGIEVEQFAPVLVADREAQPAAGQIEQAARRGSPSPPNWVLTERGVE